MACRLVIDDHDELRGTVRALLERAGYEVREASNGREGFACCQAHAIDPVITDLLMPEQEGLETIQQLRSMQPVPKIIAMSGGGQMGELDFLHVAMVLGADRTVQKPVRARDLLTAVQHLLGGT